MQVVALRDQPRGSDDLSRPVGGISQQMLTKTLKTPERDGMVGRTACPITPPKVEYALSDLGRSLALPVRQPAEWARPHLPAIHNNRQRYNSAR
ncbi:winged helix-turn-helix transcriptional regulator [Rhizosaccharibacter radicis]|uniref:Helix-turn-helix transcriptional regulator n=1 Tax=Rhizosaccharibacter radicis TaxID=2782605 RepID=A0ABT1W0I7_9PROT|nr:helix-turn-helix transcriptional regulator [Acetobacteraceae bacterium KSS12]